MNYRRLDDFLIDRVFQPLSDWMHQATSFDRRAQIKVVVHALAALIFFMVVYAWNHRSTWFDDILIMSFFMRLASLFKWLQSLPLEGGNSTAMSTDRLLRCSARMLELGFLGFFIGSMCFSADILSACFIVNSGLDLTIEYLRTCQNNPPRKTIHVAATKSQEIWGVG